MLSWRDPVRATLNSAARLFGVRIVGAEWGPRGTFAALARAKLRGFAPAAVLDIGASNGQWTRECRALFPDARYLLADPLEGNRAALATLAATDARVSVWNGAVGAHPARLPLHCHGDQSSFFASKDFAGSEASVEVRTLDSFWESGRFTAPALLKADVQGYELEVLKGASRCLESAEVLILEVSFREYYDGGALAHEVIGYLGERGFCVYDVCNYIQRPADNELVHADVMFVRRDSQLLARGGWY
jgi:FkbM family methyltransferase